nr:type II toxin-antitoxin system PemK/MazF family toxin [Pseudomonas ficuserectae]
MQGDFGKPRPALVIQANQFSEHTSVTVLPVTSTLVAAPLLLSADRRKRLAEAFSGHARQDHDTQA